VLVGQNLHRGVLGAGPNESDYPTNTNPAQEKIHDEDSPRIAFTASDDAGNEVNKQADDDGSSKCNELNKGFRAFTACFGGDSLLLCASRSGALCFFLFASLARSSLCGFLLLALFRGGFVDGSLSGVGDLLTVGCDFGGVVVVLSLEGIGKILEWNPRCPVSVADADAIDLDFGDGDLLVR
jgi:hypothetical protein